MSDLTDLNYLTTAVVSNPHIYRYVKFMSASETPQRRLIVFFSRTTVIAC